jgi:FKBP12-rapamycin complex-associated protein
MLACGLSEPLVQALVAIAKFIPPLLKTIQGGVVIIPMDNILKLSFSDRLLDLLSNILSGQPYKPLGAPPTLARNDMVAINRDLNPTQVSKRLQIWAFQ